MEPPATDELMLALCRFLNHPIMLSRFLAAYPDAVTVDRGDDAGQVCININWPFLMHEFNTRQFGELPKRSRTSYATSRDLLPTYINHWSWPHLLNAIHPDAAIVGNAIDDCSSVAINFSIGKNNNPNGGRVLSIIWTNEQLKRREFGELDSTIASITDEFDNLGTNQDILLDFLYRTVLEKRAFSYTDNDTAKGMEIDFTIDVPGIDAADKEGEDVFEPYC